MHGFVSESFSHHILWSQADTTSVPILTSFCLHAQFGFNCQFVNRVLSSQSEWGLYKLPNSVGLIIWLQYSEEYCQAGPFLRHVSWLFLRATCHHVKIYAPHQCLKVHYVLRCKLHFSQIQKIGNPALRILYPRINFSDAWNRRPVFENCSTSASY